MPIRIDKNIIRPDIPGLPTFHMIIVSGRQHGVNQVPEFVLLEKLITHVLSVLNLVAEQVRVIVVSNDGNATVPTEAFALVGLLNGLHQAVVFGNLFYAGLPFVELLLVGESYLCPEVVYLFGNTNLLVVCEHRVADFDLLDFLPFLVGSRLFWTHLSYSIKFNLV